MQDMMDTMDIAFPHLGIYLRNVPKTIMIGNFSIAIYGIIIALAMICGILMAAHMARKTGLKPDTVWDISIWLIIFSIVGARLYYVIFMWDSYKDNLLQIFNLRAGGLAIYGGIIAAVITLLIYCRVKKQNPRLLMDTAAYGLVLGQIIGRWGNFFNREVFGRYTDSLFAMRIPVAMVRPMDITADIEAHMSAGTNYIQVHPTFLYEGLWNLALLIVMRLFLKHKKFDGEITLLYFGGYGIGRAWIEAIRTDQLYLIGTKIPVSMVLGIAMAVVCLILEVIARTGIRRGKKLPLTTASGAAPGGSEKQE